FLQLVIGFFFFFQAEDGIRDRNVTGVQTCALPISPDKDIGTARKWVEEGIEKLIPFAESHGVKLGIEPLHPMFAADRSVVSTLGQANAISEKMDTDQVGVVVDVYHVWWDPCLYQEIERAKGNILGFHVSDWIVPLPDMFKGRGMMGDGVIEI